MLRNKVIIVSFYFLIIFGNFAQETAADWWDDFVESVHEKLLDGAHFIREKAGPAIREKFDDTKETLQDPETHEQIQSWIREKAVPALEEKWIQFKTFVNEEVAPQIQKIYEAGVEANDRHRERQRTDEKDEKNENAEKERRRRRR